MRGSLVATYRAAFEGLPRPVWHLAGITLIHRSGTMVLPFLVLYLTVQLGMDVRTSGVFLAVYGVGSVVGAVLGGRLADAIGTRHAMQTTLLAAGVGFWVLSAMTTPVSLAMVLFATAAAAEGFRPASSAALADVAPAAARTRAFALRRLAINLGMAIGPALGGLLATYDYRWLFWLDGGTCFAAAVVIAVWMNRDAFLPLAPEAVDSAGSAPSTVEGPEPWRDWLFMAVLGATLLSNLTFYQFFGAYGLTMKQDFGHSEAVIGGLFAFNTVLIVLFEMVLVYRLRNHRPLLVVAAGSVVMAVTFVLLPLDPRIAYAFAVMALLTVGEMLISPLLEGWAADRFAGAQIGRAMGLFAASFSLAFVVAPVLGTAVYARYGYQALWHGCAALTLVSALAYVWIDRMARSTDCTNDLAQP